MRLAYLTGRYPAVSHTFVLREVAALRALGVAIESFSVWRSGPNDLLSSADRAEDARTFALLPPVMRTYAAAHGAALRSGLGAYLRHLLDALRLGPPGIRGKLVLGGSWFLESIVLWHQCRQRTIHHVHVHLNGTAPAVALLAGRFEARVTGRRNLTWSMTVHGPSEFYEVTSERLAEKVREASFVVCTSYHARSQIMTVVDEHYWEKLHVIRCGVSSRPDQGDAAGRTDGRAPQVLSVARLAAAKGQAVLIEAVAQLVDRGSPVRLTLIGEGPKRGVLEELIAQRGLNDRVSLLGALGAPEVAAHYRQADVFCLSSLAEGIPIVLMEAMAAGLPVVAPWVMGIPELVEDGVGGLLVAPSRPDELAAALERLLEDRELRIRLGRAGREKVRAEFDVESSARQLRDLFATCQNRS